MEIHKLEIGSFDSVIIEKLYGPTIYCNLRITAMGADAKWLVEREKITQDYQGNDVTTWEKVCEIDAQESIDFR